MVSEWSVVVEVAEGGREGAGTLTGDGSREDGTGTGEEEDEEGGVDGDSVVWSTVLARCFGEHVPERGDRVEGLRLLFDRSSRWLRDNLAQTNKQHDKDSCQRQRKDTITLT